MRKTPAIIQEILDDIFSEEVEEVEEFEAVYMEDNGEDYLDENDEEDVEEATSDEEDTRLYWCICQGDGDGELVKIYHKKFQYLQLTRNQIIVSDSLRQCTLPL